MKKQGITLPGKKAPQVAAARDIGTQLDKMSLDLGIKGQGGDPPLGMEGLVDPLRLLDSSRNSQATYMTLAQTIYPDRVKPIEVQIEGIKVSLPDHEGSWQLYNEQFQLMKLTLDYMLSIGASHVVVRRKVLLATKEALQDETLPEAERTGLALDLGELLALISQEINALLAARDKTGASQEALAAALAELEAERHMVDVMRRVALKEPVSQAEMDAASATYERYLGDARSTAR